MRALTLAGAFAVLAAALAGCGGSNPSRAVAEVTVPIVVKNGKAVGGVKRVTVSQNAPVTLVVTSDVADEVHVHGYDKSVDVKPGKPARLSFDASIAGRFEVELESRALQIAELEVRP